MCLGRHALVRPTATSKRVFPNRTAIRLICCAHLVFSYVKLNLEYNFIQYELCICTIRFYQLTEKA